MTDNRCNKQKDCKADHYVTPNMTNRKAGSQQWTSGTHLHPLPWQRLSYAVLFSYSFISLNSPLLAQSNGLNVKKHSEVNYSKLLIT